MSIFCQECNIEHLCQECEYYGYDYDYKFKEFENDCQFKYTGKGV